MHARARRFASDHMQRNRMAPFRSRRLTVNSTEWKISVIGSDARSEFGRLGTCAAQSYTSVAHWSNIADVHLSHTHTRSCVAVLIKLGSRKRRMRVCPLHTINITPYVSFAPASAQNLLFACRWNAHTWQIDVGMQMPTGDMCSTVGQSCIYNIHLPANTTGELDAQRSAVSTCNFASWLVGWLVAYTWRPSHI